ncbi:unnamed protein product [Arctia plantaginis]|uniref:DUF659 domain-containing protein n=1 Tax=Arctia plantaginis TaxID=874455 RepID=A0A8S0YU36_ARCPL|nr:unnamed protein product [Arctia plantaginis]CAB3232309.1 unnamed protein product [Arctia plantaginis]
MSKHIQNCKKCPNSVKEKYIQSTTAVLEKMAEKQESSDTSPFTSAKSKISGGITSFVDKMNPADQDKANELLSRAIYASRAPLSMMDNPCWKDFFSFLRPAYKIPSRYMLSGPFLEREYKNVSTMVAEAIANANSVGLAADGWSNIRNEPIVNFVVTTPKPFLYKVLLTGKSSHIGEYMAHEISCVIDEIGQQKIFGLVTDNAANMKST